MLASKFLGILLLTCSITLAQQTVFEQSKGKQTGTITQIMAFYQILAEQHKTIQIQYVGTTDAGVPLPVVVYSPYQQFEPKKLQNNNPSVLLILNGIHPGEPDGIEASQLLFKELVRSDESNLVVVCVPFYNIGGMQQRSKYTRVNQNGPLERGFRGNAKNLDLNRDFIKLDSKNAFTFAQLFQKWDPDIFIDTHVSNGADYQHVITLLSTQANKLGEPLSELLTGYLEPYIYEKLEKAGYPPCPYVNVWGTTPDKGYAKFFDYPRYSSGYAALFQTIGLLSETHMLKPFKERVQATHLFLGTIVNFLQQNGKLIKEKRSQAKKALLNQREFTLDWVIDSSSYRQINFLGYEGTYIPSEVTTGKRLYYDHNKPYSKLIPYYQTYRPRLSAVAPKAYIIPQAWQHVIDRLLANGVQLEKISQDTVIEVTAYKITSYKTAQAPFEGHYFHSDTEVSSYKTKLNVKKGDYWIHMDQPTRRFLMEVLEPQAPDSYFNWNFFDPILQQKEHFSPYVFEDKAKELLDKDQALQSAFAKKVADDPAFAQDTMAQLQFIFVRSAYFEPNFRQYPVYRVE